MEHTVKDDTSQQSDSNIKSTLDSSSAQELASTSLAHHGQGHVDSSTKLGERVQHVSASASDDATVAYQQVGLLRAELAAVKESLASYESTLQQLLGVSSVPGGLHQVQRTGADGGASLEAQRQSVATISPATSAPSAAERLRQASSNTAEQEENRLSTVVPLVQQHDAFASFVLERKSSADTAMLKQSLSQERAQDGAAAGTSISPPPIFSNALHDLLLQPQPLFATPEGAPETKLQASASAPSFSGEQSAVTYSSQQAAASTMVVQRRSTLGPIDSAPFGGQQAAPSTTVVQRRSTVGPIDSTPAGGYDLLQANLGLGTFTGVRPPSPYQVPLSPPISVSNIRQQQYMDAGGSHNLTPAAPFSSIGVHAAGARMSSPGAGTSYSASPILSGNILSPHGHSAAGGLLPPLPGKQSRYSDPTTPAAAAAAAAGLASSPGSRLLASLPVCSSMPLSGPGQGLPAGWSQLGPMHPDTVGSLTLSPPEVAAALAGGVGTSAVLPVEGPDVLPSSSSTSVDQFTGHQRQAAALQQQQWQHGEQQEVAVHAEQLVMQQQQQQLVAALAQLGIHDTSLAQMMTASPLMSAAAGSVGGLTGAGLTHDLGLEAQAAAAALAASGVVSSSSHLALQQQAIQAQTIASLQAQAEFQALHQAQLLQLLQQQQYSPFLQQLLAAQAAPAGGLRPPQGPLSPWASYTESSTSSSSSGRRSSRGGDVHSSAKRDVRKGAGERTGRAVAAGEGAASSRQPRSSDSSPDWRRVFVGNIGWWVDEQMLQRVFTDYGTIIDAQVMWNTKLLAKGKRVNREFAFISFTTPEEAGNAIHWLNGRYVEGITKDRDGLTVQYEAQGVGKTAGQGCDPPLHLQQIVRFGLAGQQQHQQMILQQLQQNALDLLSQQQQQHQQQPWQHTSDSAFLQQLGRPGVRHIGQQQQAGLEELGLGLVHDASPGGTGAAVGPSDLQRPVSEGDPGGL